MCVEYRANIDSESPLSKDRSLVGQLEGAISSGCTEDPF